MQRRPKMILITALVAVGVGLVLLLATGLLTELLEYLINLLIRMVLFVVKHTFGRFV